MLSRPAVASSATGQPARFFSTSVSGPGQNAAASFSAAASNTARRLRGGEIEHMRDQRIERRPALGGVEPRDRGAVGGVGAEAVDRLGRERDQAAVGEAERRVGDGDEIGGSKRVSIVSVISSFVSRCALRRALRLAGFSFAASTLIQSRLRSSSRFCSRSNSRAIAVRSQCLGQQQELLAHLGAVERLLRRALEAVDAAGQRAAVLERDRDGRGDGVAVLGLIGHRDGHALRQRADRRIVERLQR